MYLGIKKLQDEGLDKLDEEGNTLISSVDGAMEVKDKLLDAAKDYDNFAGINKDMDGSVKFIMKVKAEDSQISKKQTTENEDNSSTKSDNNSNSDSSLISWIKSKFNK